MLKKSSFVIILLLFLLFPSEGVSQKDTVLIDFGTNLSVPPWNNITSASGSGTYHLANSKGMLTGFDLTVTDAFSSVNTNGTTAPNPALGIPATASNDNFFGNPQLFGNSVEPTGAVRLSGLDPQKRYLIDIFASRMASDNRETKYVISGLTTDSFLLSVSNNTSLSVVDSLYPDAGGTITITASPGPNNNNVYGFFHLSAVKVIYDHIQPSAPQSLELLAPKGGEFWQIGQKPAIEWESSGVGMLELSYSVDGGNTWKLISNVFGYQQKYDWTIPIDPSATCRVRLKSDSLTKASPGMFTISNTADSCLVVVLGSSTAAGAGATVKDSSWVKRYAHAAYQHNTRNRLKNLAFGGYTTWHIMPTGTVVPSGLPFTVDSIRNITAALALQPYAIIINMPSNDASYQVTVARQLLNYATIAGEAANSGVKLWVSTTQPRNFSSATQLQIQHDMADSIQAIFGSYAIDFWNGLADTSGHILGNYDSGDGIHLNNAGHKLLSERVIAKGIDAVYCMTTSIQESTPMDLHYHPTLFPNPFDDHFTLTFATSSSGEIRLMLYDIAGRVIAQTDEKVHAAGIHQIQWSPDISGATTHQFMLCTITIHDARGDYTKTLKVFRF